MSNPGQGNAVAAKRQHQLAIDISSVRQLQIFNDRGVVPVLFDLRRSHIPSIKIAGHQSPSLSVWETRSESGFVTNPSCSSNVVTVRFVTNGRIQYRSKAGNATGTPGYATLVGFEDLCEVQASSAFSATSGTIAVGALTTAEAALFGESQILPPFQLVADMASPGIKALFLTIRQVLHRLKDREDQDDLVSPLIQEIVCYQLLSAWPRGSGAVTSASIDAGPRDLRAALDYIEANLAVRLTLADVAKAAGISVRSLQSKFRQEIGKTPIQFIIDRRLMQVHQDLMSPRNAAVPIAEVSKRWGFVHVSDFSQRYRRMYGCTPAETRRGGARSEAWAQ